MGGNVVRMEEMGNVYNILVGKLEGKRPRGRPRRRQEDNIRMDLREIGWEYVDWMQLKEDSTPWTYLVGQLKGTLPSRHCRHDHLQLNHITDDSSLSRPSILVYCVIKSSHTFLH